jgi:hypothetical protein
VRALLKVSKHDTRKYDVADLTDMGELAERVRATGGFRKKRIVLRGVPRCLAAGVVVTRVCEAGGLRLLLDTEPSIAPLLEHDTAHVLRFADDARSGARFHRSVWVMLGPSGEIRAWSGSSYTSPNFKNADFVPFAPRVGDRCWLEALPRVSRGEAWPAHRSTHFVGICFLGEPEGNAS